MFSDFDKALAHLESFMNLEKTTMYTVRTYRLDRMAALLDYFDHPEKSFKAVHLAGSKGKGSTARFIQSALTELGFKTGSYASPHVTDYRERFTVNGGFVEEAQLLETVNAMLGKVKGFSFAEETGVSLPTTFELFTLFAFLLFRDTGCDWAVIETGLGGRLDATNVLIPLVSVITSIELEHTAILGNTIEEIAFEKAGIIKEGIPVVIGKLKPEAEKVMRQVAAEKNTAVTSIAETAVSIDSETSLQGESCSFSWSDGTVERMRLKMRGGFQAENAALSLLVLRLLGFTDQLRLRSGLEQAYLPGRFELIEHEPRIFIDGAHTEDSLKRLCESYLGLLKTPGILIFGAVLGKNHEFMAEFMVGRFPTIIISTPGTFKPSDPEALFTLFKEKQAHLGSTCEITLLPDPLDAYTVAKELAKGQSSQVLVTGSFYMAAEIRSVSQSRA